jgi:hypothetical protein
LNSIWRASPGLHQARHALRPAGAGEEPDLDLRQADPGRVHVRQDPVVAGERQLEGAAEADPVHGRREGLAAGLEPPVEERKAAALLEEVAHRRLLAALADQAHVLGAQALEHGEVRAAREGLLARRDHAALHGVVGHHRVDEGGEVLHHLRGDDVHGAARHVPGGERDAVAVDLKAEIGEVHLYLPRTLS